MLNLYSFLFQRSVDANATMKQDLRSFKLILEYIKALPVSAFMQFPLKVASTTASCICAVKSVVQCRLQCQILR